MYIETPLEPIVGGSIDTTPRRLAVPVRTPHCWRMITSDVLTLMLREPRPVTVTTEKKPGLRPPANVTGVVEYPPRKADVVPLKSAMLNVVESSGPALVPELKIVKSFSCRTPVPVVVTRSPHWALRSVEATAPSV